MCVVVGVDVGVVDGVFLDREDVRVGVGIAVTVGGSLSVGSTVGVTVWSPVTVGMCVLVPRVLVAHETESDTDSEAVGGFDIDSVADKLLEKLDEIAKVVVVDNVSCDCVPEVMDDLVVVCGAEMVSDMEMVVVGRQFNPTSSAWIQLPWLDL